jgi:pSer/pThr/pTyr-binding forkhead associated (FHA) protein
VTSIGRGRDNQIQIRDDTKVSRYHCRILREPTGYFVEDNNSSNGTMVNGELITRRKVEGGEDVTIGETLFKFIMI